MLKIGDTICTTKSFFSRRGAGVLIEVIKIGKQYYHFGCNEKFLIKEVEENLVERRVNYKEFFKDKEEFEMFLEAKQDIRDIIDKSFSLTFENVSKVKEIIQEDRNGINNN